jgi:hypothetical protein
VGAIIVLMQDVRPWIADWRSIAILVHQSCHEKRMLLKAASTRCGTFFARAFIRLISELASRNAYVSPANSHFLGPVGKFFERFRMMSSPGLPPLQTG